MPKFVYEATVRSGETRKGEVEAESIEAVESRLRGDGMTVVKVKKKPIDLANIQFGTGIVPKDLQIFTRQLATMIDAGLPLVQCLEILSTQTDNKGLAKVLTSVKNSVEQGATFSDALRKHPKVFDELYVNLVAAGELGGILDTILGRLAIYIEKAVKLKGQLKSAMIYPTSIMVIAAGVIAVMMIKVIPVFEDMYKSFAGAVLPAPTRVVMGISKGFQKYWYVGLGAIIGTVMLIGFLTSKPKGRLVMDKILLRLPVIGGVLRKIVVARFTRTLGTLLSSGVPILDALDICAKTSGNKVVENSIQHARSKIAEGHDMSGPLAETKVFPSMVVQMIGVGEQTGAMDQMLQKIADFYEDEVDTAVAGMTAMIEPIMMAFLGIVIGGLIIAMYLPIFGMAGAVGG